MSVCPACNTPETLLCLKCSGVTHISGIRAEARREALALAEPLWKYINSELIEFQDCTCRGTKICRTCRATGVVQDYHRALAKEPKP